MHGKPIAMRLAHRIYGRFASTEDNAHARNYFPTANRFGYIRSKGTFMSLTDPAFITAISALLTAAASLVWAVRRDPKGE